MKRKYLRLTFKIHIEILCKKNRPENRGSIKTIKSSK